MANHQLILKSPFGDTLAVIDDFLSLSYARSVNSVGKMEVDLRPGYDPDMFPRDSRWEIYRAVGDRPMALQMETYWLTRQRTRNYLPNHRWATSILAHDLIDLLNRRLVAYTRETPYADKIIEAEIDGSDYEDNLIKAYVRENMSTLTLDMFTGEVPDPERNLGDLLTIEADESLAATPSAEKQASWRSLLTVCQELAELSQENGVELFFDVVGSKNGLLTFRTYVGQRGTDRTVESELSSVIFSPQFGNLENITITTDWRDEATAAYVGGEGMGVERLIMEVRDENRTAESPFNRIEIFVDARDWCDPSVLELEGQAALRRHTPRKRVSAEAVDIPDTIYGVHYGYGDRVTVEADNTVFDCHVSAVQVAVEDGRENKTIRLEGVEVEREDAASTIVLAVQRSGTDCSGYVI